MGGSKASSTAPSASKPGKAKPDPKVHPLPEVGDAAPDFELSDQSGNTHALTDYRGQWVVLYFYPKDSTPGCTKEACQFRDASNGLRRRGAVVFGVSADNETSHAKFADNQGLTFPLLADTDAAVCGKYGAWQERNMYGRKFMGIARTTFLIDPTGKVAHRWDKVKVGGHVDDVIATLDTCKLDACK